MAKLDFKIYIDTRDMRKAAIALGKSFGEVANAMSELSKSMAALEAASITVTSGNELTKSQKIRRKIKRGWLRFVEIISEILYCISFQAFRK